MIDITKNTDINTGVARVRKAARRRAAKNKENDKGEWERVIDGEVDARLGG